MRDKLKSVEYFDNFIEEDTARIKKFSEKLNNAEVKPERILPVKSRIHDLRLGIMIARYSKGDEVSLLKEEFEGLVNDWEEVFEPEYYNKSLKMIALAVLFDIRDKYVKKIRSMLNKSNINDWLLNFLLDSIDGKKTSETSELLFKDSFYTLQRVVFEQNKNELLVKYLSKEWYNEDCGCYEAHKSKQNIYYGYWSFEAGAIAKILHLDDTDIMNTIYYPYDLVHYKN